MDSTSINLVGSEISQVEIDGNIIKVHFDPAYLIKTMTGSVEQTRWWQNGALVFTEAELQGDIPRLPATCSGGDVGENIYTYRDMVPVPLESRGSAHCRLKLENSDQIIEIQAKGVQLAMLDVAKYIEHIRSE